jgi:hypothetical protein
MLGLGAQSPCKKDEVTKSETNTLPPLNTSIQTVYLRPNLDNSASNLRLNSLLGQHFVDLVEDSQAPQKAFAGDELLNQEKYETNLPEAKNIGQAQHKHTKHRPPSNAYLRDNVVQWMLWIKCSNRSETSAVTRSIL